MDIQMEIKCKKTNSRLLRTEIGYSMAIILLVAEHVRVIAMTPAFISHRLTDY